MGSGKLGDSGMVALIAKIMVVVIIFLFLVVFFMFFAHLYAKWFWSNNQEDLNGRTRRRRRRRRRMDFAGGYQEVNVLRGGLDPSILKTIPIVPFSTKDFKDGIECSVCLTEVSEGEKARLLPKCNHGFHVECIDMWFQSHATCPLCRNPVSEMLSSNSTTTESTVEEGSASAETPNLPTNVLFWGDETQVSTFGPYLECPTTSASTSNRPDGMLVIDIPRRTSGEEEEEQKTPTPTGLRSLTRLFSRVNPCSPRNVDVEQGSGGQS